MARSSRITYTYNCIMIFTHCFRSHSYLTHCCCCCCCFFPSLLIPWFDNQCWPFFPRWQDEKEQQTLNSLAERKVFVCSCVLLLSITFRSMKSYMETNLNSVSIDKSDFLSASFLISFEIVFPFLSFHIVIIMNSCFIKCLCLVNCFDRKQTRNSVLCQWFFSHIKLLSNIYQQEQRYHRLVQMRCHHHFSKVPAAVYRW